jgi:hypothetical protein
VASRLRSAAMRSARLALNASVVSEAWPNESAQVSHNNPSIQYQAGYISLRASLCCVFCAGDPGCVTRGLIFSWRS